MLSAITQDRKKVYADEVSREDKNQYFCPECGSKLILRQGTKNIWHFAHKSNDNKSCILRKYDNESLEHRMMKKIIKKIIERDNNCLKSELEYKIGSKIADYYFEIYDKWNHKKKIAVECVHKHTDIDTFRAKNEYYVEQGVFVIWLFEASRLGYCDIFSNNINDNFYDEIRINEIIKESHTMYFGKVYAIDINKKIIFEIHLDNVKRTTGGYRYYLSRTRKPNPKKIFNFNINSFKKAKIDKYLPYNRNVASMYTPKWW